MRGGVLESLGLVVAAPHDHAVVDDHAADRHLVGALRGARLAQRRFHAGVVVADQHHYFAESAAADRAGNSLTQRASRRSTTST